jgi:hypothetical protein
MMDLPEPGTPLDGVIVWHIRQTIPCYSSYEEAADALGVSKKTLWEWRKRHGIEECPTSLKLKDMVENLASRGMTL